MMWECTTLYCSIVSCMGGIILGALVVLGFVYAAGSGGDD